MEENTNRTASKVFIPPFKVAIKEVHKQQMEIKWAETWTAELKKNELWVFAPTPSIKVLQLNKKIKKLESALITQMRTGKISLRAFLYDWKWVNNSQFECGHRSQIVWNNLWEYRKLTCLKRKTWRDQKRKEHLGIVEWRKMLTHPSYAKKRHTLWWKQGFQSRFKV